ncbi:MAG: hypothetical protein CME88_02105 [Hirschia sp.]|nr:hypothetical protein [Hirschia sp.]MBF17156.1 hypothetical protein [Hirschia sp.]
MSDSLLIERDGGIATITFNRPDKANYIDNDWLDRMAGSFRAWRRDKTIRAVIIKSTGRYFMAGGDMNFHDAVLNMPPDERFEANYDIVQRWNEMMEELLSLPQPVIASVQGGTIGASVGLVAACDMVVAGRSAFFSIAHVRHGGCVDGYISHFLPRQIGARRSLQMALTGERVGAEEAERIGLIGQMVEDDQLNAVVDKLAHEMACGPTFAYGLIKDQFLDSFERSRQDQVHLEALYTARGSNTQDWREGSISIVEKRAPNFTGQ